MRVLMRVAKLRLCHPSPTKRTETSPSKHLGKLLPLGAPVKRTELSAPQLSRGAVDEVRYRR